MSRKTIIKKTASKTVTSIIKALKPYKNTIDDNGCEFRNTKKLTKWLKQNHIFASHIIVGRKEWWKILMD